MTRLGIFLGYSPKQLDPHQGISRLVMFIVKGALASPDTTVTIAAPAWLKSDIYNILEDAGIPLNTVELVTTKGEPFLSRIQRWWQLVRGKPRKKKRSPRLFRMFSALGLGFIDFLSTPSTVVFLAGIALLIVGGAILAIPALIVGLVVGIILAVRTVKRRVLGSRFVQTVRGLARRMYRAIVAIGAYDRLRANELGRLVQILNRRKDIDVWYVPAIVWPEVAGLIGRIVVAAPDIVFYEHPAQYNHDSERRILGRIARTLAKADHIICYSEHVKRFHYVEKNNIPPEKISVIPHGLVDMGVIDRGPANRAEALDILSAHLKGRNDYLPAYLQEFCFDDVDFLFYSSQYRPHKNIESLVYVYEKLLRERYRPIKLILTAQWEHNVRLRNLIEAKGLQRDVLSFHSVPNNVLASLYMLARLSVTPTQFEGGFPFTFSEAYSVGTPSVMSRIPVVKEMITDERLLDLMTFDPLDRDEMLRKIEWGLDHREELLAAQHELFAKFVARPWTSVASEYLDVMGSANRAGARRLA